MARGSRGALQGRCSGLAPAEAAGNPDPGGRQDRAGAWLGIGRQQGLVHLRACTWERGSRVGAGQVGTRGTEGGEQRPPELVGPKAAAAEKLRGSWGRAPHGAPRTGFQPQHRGLPGQGKKQRSARGCEG